MATKKREIYACLATQLRHHKRCAKAEKKCPGAMGLYAFLVMQSRGEETHGETFDSIAFASWGADTGPMLAYRRKQAEALIEAGLVVREGEDLLVVKYLEHNDGPEEIAANKEAANVRQDRRRHPEKYAAVTRDTPVTSHGVSRGSPSSCSSSISGSGSADHRSEDPDSSPRAIPPDPPSRPHNDSETPCAIPTSVVELGPPAWWAGACDTVAANVAPVDDRGARWLEYAAARERKGWATNQRDAVGWLSTVVRSERRNARAAPKSGGGPRGDRQGLPAHMPWLPTGTDPDPFGENS